MNYLLRVTGIDCILKLVEISCEQNLPTLDAEGELLDDILACASDEVPNVRFRVARACEGAGKSLIASSRGGGRDVVRRKILPVLEKLAGDADRDVKFFAERGLKALR